MFSSTTLGGLEPVREADWFDIDAPFQTVASGMAKVDEQLTQLTLSIAYFEVVLLPVTQACLAQLQLATCRLPNANIAVEYTQPSVILSSREIAGTVHYLETQGLVTDNASEAADDILEEYIYKYGVSDSLSAYEVRFQSRPMGDSATTYVEALISETKAGQTNTIASRGLADELDGYLVSSARRGSDEASSQLLYREVVESIPLGISVCDPTQTSTQCEIEEDWLVTAGTNPNALDQFLSSDELDTLAGGLKLPRAEAFQ